MPALKGKDVIPLARRQISDAVPDSNQEFRWPDDTALMPYVNLAVREVTGRHPEAKYVTKVDPTPVVDQTSTDVDLQIDDSYKMAVMHFVVHLALREDSEDGANSRVSIEAFSLFEGALIR